METKTKIKSAVLAFGFALCVSLPVFSQARSQMQFIVNGDFFFDIPVQGEEQKNTLGTLDMGFGGALGFELRPFKNVGFFAGAEYHSFTAEKNLIDPYNMLSANLGVGGRFPLTGALSLNADAYAGVYATTHGNISHSGIDAGVKVSVRYNFAPSFGVGLGGGFGTAIHKDFPINYVPVNAGFSINMTELMSSEQNVSGDLSSLDPVFPALYSWYAENSFGKAVIENFEADEISNVKVYFYMEQFMNKATLCGSIDKLRPGKSGTVELKAIFNPTILSNQDMTNTSASIIVEYNRLGKRFKVENRVNIPVYNPNAMSWDDDRRAAVFVSKNNSVAVEFAKHVASSVRPLMNENENENYQLAKALFGALTEYGMGYVIDPTSSYSANVGTTSIDFLQFPHQTLKFKAGDCDDLSILYCSLLESLGIESAFITVPGHIYAAVNLDLPEEEGRKIYGEDTAIFYDGKTWIPVEVTMTKDTFAAATKYGINEWNKYAATDNALIYPMHSNWEYFKSVNVSTEEFEVVLPSREKIQARFK